ncbi:hypothetical protein Taro_024817, partial [Colocasia esculenta]|nr:hypothetical protein [Colocasia esculenta]
KFSRRCFCSSLRDREKPRRLRRDGLPRRPAVKALPRRRLPLSLSLSLPVSAASQPRDHPAAHSRSLACAQQRQPPRPAAPALSLPSAPSLHPPTRRLPLTPRPASHPPPCSLSLPRLHPPLPSNAPSCSSLSHASPSLSSAQSAAPGSHAPLPPPLPPATCAGALPGLRFPIPPSAYITLRHPPCCSHARPANPIPVSAQAPHSIVSNFQVCRFTKIPRINL